MRRHVAALERDLAALERATGLRLGLFAETGSLHVIDEDLDASGCYPGARGADREDGGVVVASLGGLRFAGGGW
jgi:hypothetical protein